MKNITLTILTFILLSSCDNSKWETIRGYGINDEPKSIDNVIYFENESNGLVGGYTLIEDKNAKTADGLVTIPTLFITDDAGKNWKEIEFNTILKATVDNAYLHGDTLICLLDTMLLFSTDKGKNLQPINDSNKKNKIIAQHFKLSRYDVRDHDFIYNNKKYNIKERYQNDFAIVIVCYGDKTLTDYYFVSFDNGNHWKFLQESFGDNRARYLYEDKYLYCYDFPFGLQRLKLK